jgi:pilus assembly protein Flp/PilA
VGRTRQGNEAGPRAGKAATRSIRSADVVLGENLPFAGRLSREAMGGAAAKGSEGMMREGFRRFLTDTRGATAVEYGVICACIFLVVVAALVNFGAAATNMFNNVSNAVGGTP